MVGAITGTAIVKFHFQYSLCRVVLMVGLKLWDDYSAAAFSTRSVESF